MRHRNNAVARVRSECITPNPPSRAGVAAPAIAAISPRPLPQHSPAPQPPATPLQIHETRRTTSSICRAAQSHLPPRRNAQRPYILPRAC
uniref:Uncharacterized protein n=1 Tax=Aegilops tauschii subsp. strangulata TaxID=200361 RepID=A0A452Y1M0_AEGTS